MEPEHRPLEDSVPLQPRCFSGSMLSFQGVLYLLHMARGTFYNSSQCWGELLNFGPQYRDKSAYCQV